MLPGLGPLAIGGSGLYYDGHTNPLNLLHALHEGVPCWRCPQPLPRPCREGPLLHPNTTVGNAKAARDLRNAIGDGEIGAPKASAEHGGQRW